MTAKQVPHYQAIHKWVTRNFGKAIECEHCLTPDAKIYDWANISGEYRKVRSDWKQLCRKCHGIFDNKSDLIIKAKTLNWEDRDNCKNGHTLSVVGYYISKTGNKTQRHCKECSKIASRVSWRRRYYALNNV